MTTTAGSVMPVRSIDGAVVGDRDGPGEVSIRLHILYWEKRWSGWVLLATCVPLVAALAMLVRQADLRQERQGVAATEPVRS